MYKKNPNNKQNKLDFKVSTRTAQTKTSRILKENKRKKNHKFASKRQGSIWKPLDGPPLLLQKPRVDLFILRPDIGPDHRVSVMGCDPFGH